MTNNLVQLEIYKSLWLCIVSSLLWYGACNAMNAEVVRLIDLHDCGGHVIVPRPYDIPAPTDLGEEDLLLQNILQKAVYQVSSLYFRTNQPLDVDTLIPNNWTTVNAHNFNAVRQEVARASEFCKNISALYKASINHDIGASVAATLFAHITKQGHIWHRRTTPTDGNLHYISWIIAMRVIDTNNIPNFHSSFLIDENEDALSFFKKKIKDIDEAVMNNVANLRITTDQNTIFIDISMKTDVSINFVCCNPAAVTAVVPQSQDGGAGGLVRLRALIPAVGQGQPLTFQQKADAIRGIADCIGQNVNPLPQEAFPTLNNGLSASVVVPQRTNTIRIIINRQGAAPYIASMFPLPR